MDFQTSIKTVSKLKFFLIPIALTSLAACGTTAHSNTVSAAVDQPEDLETIVALAVEVCEGRDRVKSVSHTGFKCD